MKTLTSTLLAELGLTVTRPGYLVRLGYSSTLYLSTVGDISWGGNAWSGADVKVSGINQDGGAASNARLTIGNTDNAFAALVLNEGASDIPSDIWAVYAGAPGDAVQVFAGVLDGADIAADKVSFALDSQGNKTLYSPRVFISPPTFNFLQPAGTRIAWGGETFVLERR